MGIFSLHTNIRKIFSLVNQTHFPTRGVWSLLACLALPLVLTAQEAEWIWSPLDAKNNVPEQSVCHFRRSFNVITPQAAMITIAADDTYELHINGKKIGSGSGTKRLLEYDVKDFILNGQNVVAIKVTNKSGSTAALCARVLVQDKSGKWISYSSDKSWRTNPNALPQWNTIAHTDRGWEYAQSFGKLGETAPWDLSDESAKDEIHNGSRFSVADDFEVQKVLDAEVTGSVIAMTFNEFGQTIVSREGGPLVLLHDTDNDKTPDEARVICDLVKNCHGILSLNGELYVTADGSEGTALYRLSDKNRDGTYETAKALLQFEGELGEHGAHGLTLGPDGLIYIVVGNHTRLKNKIDEQSPYRDFYEGDLNQPRYEDPGGHAVGIKAPGGMVLRTDADGTAVQIVAGGLRNAYDLTFNRDGEIFIPDSDMESDEGTPWYRPTRVYQILPGGEYGWRSGWANWPDYYVDQVPPILNNGRGSPTGIACYNHVMFPQKYHGALFMADWSAGQIVCIRLKPNGASYKAESSVFISGNPLNVTDVDVGPDGYLYFTTGGRGTAGGLYRVKWKGTVPDTVKNVGEGITAVIRQPQLQSAYARQNIALLKREMGAKWDHNLLGVATSSANPADYRLQALDLMKLYGPTLSEDFLLHLSRESNEKVRAKSAELMGGQPTAALRDRLMALLKDGDRNVRRKACEALLRAGLTAPFNALEASLASDDRFEAWAARRLLERLPLEQWPLDQLNEKGTRIVIQATLAQIIAHPEKDRTLDSLQLLAERMTEFVSDREFIDMLRVMQVGLHRSNIKPEEVAGLRELLKEEFPSGDGTINRELIRLLVFLQESSIIDRYLEYLAGDAAELDKAHVGLHLRYLQNDWTSEQRLTLLEFYENAQALNAGNGFTRYVINVTRDFAANLTEEEGRLVLARGAEWPNAALGTLFRLPVKIDDALREQLIAIDREADSSKESAQRLKIGILALMARSGDPGSLAYMREVWENDPERRQAVAMGLSLHPQEENWPYLVRSLPILETGAVPLVLTRLRNTDQAPDEAEPYRQVILLGYKLKDKGADQAVQLLEHWTGEKLVEKANWEGKLNAWKKWFSENFPESLPAEPPTENANAKWKFDDLVEFVVKSPGVQGDAAHGAEVFSKATCVKCHRLGEQGQSVGPDLTTLSKRFTKKEILESIYYPSHVVSDQYASKTVVTTSGRTIVGLVMPGGGGDIHIVQANGEKVTLLKSEVEETTPSKQSSMPSGLLDTLEKEDIVDLMAYLVKPSTAQVATEPKKGTDKR